MHHVMLDIDGTLVHSNDFEADCFHGAVVDVVETGLDTDWRAYRHVTDSGILLQHLENLGLLGQRDAIIVEVKAAFVQRIRDRLAAHPIEPIPGAAAFVDALRARHDVVVSIATGSWRESAILKLREAGIGVDGIPFASANDHFARTEIMRLAAARAVGKRAIGCTYFGDGEWDQAACAALGYDFVLVGGARFHWPSIADFTDLERAMGYIGL